MANLNSLSTSARSIRRAAAFQDIQPVLRTLHLSGGEEESEEHRQREFENATPKRRRRKDTRFPGRTRQLHNDQQRQNVRISTNLRFSTMDSSKTIESKTMGPASWMEAA